MLTPRASRFAALVAFALSFPALARAELEFIGLLVTPDRARFALTDTATGRTDWFTLNARLGHYTLAAFDPKTDTLTLTRDGTLLKLRLVDDAKVRPMRIDLAGSITIGGAEKLEITRATLLYDQENVFPLKDSVVYRITPKRHDDGTILFAVVIEQTLAPNRVDRLAAPALTALVGQPFKLHVGDYAFEFIPR